MFHSTGEYDKNRGCYITKRGKIYMIKDYKDIKKISGVSKVGKSKIDWYNFKAGTIIKNGKKSKKNVNGGLLIVESDFKIKG